jgi:ABC-type nitrate/sulfonate/bicarbonate transport system permease component
MSGALGQRFDARRRERFPQSLTAAIGSIRLRRTLCAFGVAALLYGIASEIGHLFLPNRVWMTVHYVEGVELIPRYSSLAEEAVFLLRAGILQSSVAVSAGRVLQGLLLGSAIGIPLGFAAARAARFECLLDPWVTFFRFTPALALLPLYVIWFGFGEASKLLLIATGVAVVTLLGAYRGYRDVPLVYLDAARALGADRRTLLRKIILPAALPHLLSSLRIAVGLAWTTIVVAELIDAKMPSLGYLLVLGSAMPQVATVVIALFTMGLLVLVSDGIALGLYHHATTWMRRRDAP